METKYKFELRRELTGNDNKITITRRETYFQSIDIPVKEFAQFVAECNAVLSRISNKQIGQK